MATKTLPLLLLLFIAPAAFAQKTEALRFRASIDTCRFHNKLLNSQEKEFYIFVENTSEVLPLFKKDSVEIGIKLYVNHIMEDGGSLTIVKHVFMVKSEGEWKKINTGDYSVVDYDASQKSLRIASGEDVTFQISFSLSLDPDYPPNLKVVPRRSPLYD
jgi:hypothetical protein